MGLLDDSFGVLRRGLTYSSLRHELISDNIANASTPGYQRKDLEFSGILQANMSQVLPLRMTQSRHMPLNTESLDRFFRVMHPSDTDTKSDGNNVDLDKEVIAMTDNSLYYNTLTTVLSRKLRILKTAVSERIA